MGVFGGVRARCTYGLNNVQGVGIGARGEVFRGRCWGGGGGEGRLWEGGSGVWAQPPYTP